MTHQEDYDEPKFLRAEQRKARIPHDCSICRKPINPGTRYSRTFVVEDDGQRLVYKQHLFDCWDT